MFSGPQEGFGSTLDPCWLYRYPKAHDFAQVVNEYVPTDGTY
jgi:hypothetical protein